MEVGRAETEEERKAREEELQRNRELSKQRAKEDNKRERREMLIVFAVVGVLAWIMSFDNGRNIVIWVFGILGIGEGILWIIFCAVMAILGIIGLITGKFKGSSSSGTTIRMA